jgi:hypothetical protein
MDKIKWKRNVLFSTTAVAISKRMRWENYVAHTHARGEEKCRRDFSKKVSTEEIFERRSFKL